MVDNDWSSIVLAVLLYDNRLISISIVVAVLLYDNRLITVTVGEAGGPGDKCSSPRMG